MYVKAERAVARRDQAVVRLERQCRDLVAGLGGTVAGVFFDVNVSAWRGDRPGYRGLLAVVAAGEVDAVMVPQLTMLCRTDLEFDEYLKVCAAGGVRTYFDPSTPDGRYAARVAMGRRASA